MQLVCGHNCSSVTEMKLIQYIYYTFLAHYSINVSDETNKKDFLATWGQQTHKL